MAAKLPSASKTQPPPRNGHDKTWSCDDHAEPISFYCKEHKIPIGHTCPIKDHQKPCQLDNIGDVILEMRKTLEDKLQETEEMVQDLEKLDSKIQSCSIFVSNNLRTIKHKVNIAYEDKIKDVQDIEWEEILLINKEVDEEIRIINEKRRNEEVDEEIQSSNEIRESRINSSKVEAENKQQNIKETHAKLLSDTQKIDTTVREKLQDLKNKKQRIIDMYNSMVVKIKQMKQDDKTLVNEAAHVISSLDESVSANVHQDIDACLANIQHEVGRVKFVEGKVGGKQFSRIDGYTGKWELAKSFPMPKTIGDPLMFSLISDDELGILDRRNKDFYVSNISNGQTHKVIDGDRNMFITSCARIDSNLIVCGKGTSDYPGESQDGRITLYDGQWNVVRDISIPRGALHYYTKLHVDVEKEGMILAARCLQSRIHVINPADGQIMHTIAKQGKQVRFGLLAMSCGNILVDVGSHAFTVISRSGEEVASIRGDDWVWPWCCIDRLTDTFYITYKDEERDIHVLHHVSSDGQIQAKYIVEYEDFHCSPNNSPCLITPSGNIAVCTGDNILVYKKTFFV